MVEHHNYTDCICSYASVQQFVAVCECAGTFECCDCMPFECCVTVPGTTYAPVEYAAFLLYSIFLLPVGVDRRKQICLSGTSHYSP